MSCNHPEGKKYERNQGSKKEYKSINDEISVNVIQSETENTNIQENLNILEMELEDGVRYVWIEINGIRLRFIFDTGASDITISATEAMFLYKQGTLRQEDILGTQQYQIANGSITEGTVINLRTVQIGNKTLINVSASVVHNGEAPLLLGQSALAQFGKVSIDYKRNEITFE